MIQKPNQSRQKTFEHLSISISHLRVYNLILNSSLKIPKVAIWYILPSGISCVLWFAEAFVCLEPSSADSGVRCLEVPPRFRFGGKFEEAFRTVVEGESGPGVGGGGLIKIKDSFWLVFFSGEELFTPCSESLDFTPWALVCWHRKNTQKIQLKNQLIKGQSWQENVMHQHFLTVHKSLPLF